MTFEGIDVLELSSNSELKIGSIGGSAVDLHAHHHKVDDHSVMWHENIVKFKDLSGILGCYVGLTLLV